MSNRYLPFAKQAYKDLRKMILSGELKPGCRLVERELSEKIGVSRTPIRAALQKLSSEGLVYLSPHSGARVSQLTETDITEIYEIREVLESLAARKAVMRMTKLEIGKLEELLKKAHVAFQKGNYAKMAQINAAFYGKLYCYSGNHRLSKLLDTLCTTDTINREVILKNEDVREESINRTAELLDALKKGDKERAADLLVSYIERGKEILLETIQLNRRNNPTAG